MSEAHDTAAAETLFEAPWFPDVFPDFEKKQKTAAAHIAERILLRCGKDPDLPRIRTIVYYGCGDGSVLSELLQHLKDGGAKIGRILAFDACRFTLQLARQRVQEAGCQTRVDFAVESNPSAAFAQLPGEEWAFTALLILGHSWFYFDQAEITRAIKNFRPALLLVDIHQRWDDMIQHLPYFEAHSIRRGPETVTAAPRYGIKITEEGQSHVRMGFFEIGKETALFPKKLARVSTRDLIASSIDEPKKADLAKLEELARAGLLTGTGAGRCDYICRRHSVHESGWGQMSCYVLVPRDPVAMVLNAAYFDTINEALDDPGQDIVSTEQTEQLERLLAMFDEPNWARSDEQDAVKGCRMIVTVLPFDPHHTFARFRPMFAALPRRVSSVEQLAELPVLAQRRFPSAYGIFQTMLARSSSPQAFTLDWATDYNYSDADTALKSLEEEATGIAKLKETQLLKPGDPPPSFFMLPVYFGSLPLFTLAVKFPAMFDPATTGFDVFYSTISNLHDSIAIRLSDQFVRQRIVRQWIESSLSRDGWRQPEKPPLNPADKLALMERYLFGQKADTPANGSHTADDAYAFGGISWNGGVLGKPWKSWLLGLPSFPVNRMASAQAQNVRLWQIWQEERRVAQLDAALRISLWFEEGKFFEDDPLESTGHEDWLCRLHLDRLHQMFSSAGIHCEPMASKTDDAWLEVALRQLRPPSREAQRYFGRSTASHFLFDWMAQQLEALMLTKGDCDYRATCAAPKNHAECTRNRGPYQALKEVFCKGLANKGEAMRFTSHRLYWLLRAARRGPILVNGDDQQLPDKLLTFPSDGRRFWSADDPSHALAELVAVLSGQKLVDRVALNHTDGTSPRTFSITVKLVRELVESIGGNACDAAGVSLKRYQMLSSGACSWPQSLYGQMELQFRMEVNPLAQTIKPSPD